MCCSSVGRQVDVQDASLAAAKPLDTLVGDDEEDTESVAYDPDADDEQVVRPFSQCAV